MLVIVVYDVPAERTRVYRKLLRQKLEHIQNSVFYGNLTEGQVTKLKNQIDDQLVPEDSVMVFEAETQDYVDYTVFGSAERPGSRFT
ncbi:CRISPR-associated endonuclease Cas2 [Haloglomus salinum]|jgi:CRISPR-associated protein Cas2|uniref:CRISPR-associated endonuclease Cas2 n=1 Tax=Haloglomus salinum TaxID=2962673 RepID=UPI0020CA18C9|nr:CRISPR-associated endonuclease Cas2 [Haloglomus salinum]